MQQTDLFLLFTAPLDKAGITCQKYFREGGSEKHVHDIRGMLAASGDALDGEALNVWVQRLALDKVWEDVRRRN